MWSDSSIPPHHPDTGMNAAGSGTPAVKLPVSANQSRLRERRHTTEKPRATEETAQGSTEDQAGRTVKGQLQGHRRALGAETPVPHTALWRALTRRTGTCAHRMTPKCHKKMISVRLRVKDKGSWEEGLERRQTSPSLHP